jgi:CRP-like cAMP-binding protein
MTNTFNSTHPLYAHLRATRPFARLPEQQFAGLLKSARVEDAAMGAVLVREGDTDCDYLVLLEGELEVRRHYLSTPGVEEIDVGRLLPGQGAGEMALLHAVPRQASVRAVAPSRVLRIDGATMEELLAWSQCFAEDLQGVAEFRARMNLVRQVGPFRRLPLERVRMALECMQPVEVESDTVVVRQGEPGDRYYIIERGTAEVWRTDPLTDETAQVATLGPGEPFGEEALLLGGFRNATVTFYTPGRLWILSKEDFDALLRPLLVEEVDAAKAHALAQRGESFWLDCRYDVEFEEAHIPGAIHAPLDRIRELAHGLDKTVSYTVYCRSGRRSACAAYLLRGLGFRAASLTGGIRDWPYALESAVSCVEGSMVTKE